MLESLCLRCFVVCVMLGLVGRCSGQSRAAKTEPDAANSYGSVTGHVYLAGSDAPARFVQLALQPTRIEFPKEAPFGRPQTSDFRMYRTSLDGSYFIPHVAAGAYYVVVVQRGYASPFAAFTREELERPSVAVQQRMAATLPAVTVAPNSTANLDLTLQRGGSLSGTVRFDDGMPFAQANVQVTQRTPDGKWSSLRIVEGSAETDAEGHWSLSGLPPGEYRLAVQMAMEEQHRSSLLGENGNTMSMTTSSLPVWLGDTTRERNAKSVTLTENQSAQGLDITIPVSKMHQVTGMLVDQASGQALNAGDIKLVYADDEKEVTSARVDPETHTFTFPFVPEGEYKLRTENARLARFDRTDSAEVDPFGQNKKETVLRQYVPGEMPLIVQGDMSSVNFPVQAKAARGGGSIP